MRFGNSNISLDLDFQRGPIAQMFRRAESNFLQHFVVYRMATRVETETTGFVSLPPGVSMISFNWRGTILARTIGNPYPQVVAPRSAYFLRSGRTAIRLAKGDHSATMLLWPNAVTPLLEVWVTAYSAQLQQTRTAACRSLSLGLEGAAERMKLAMEKPRESVELALVSVVYEAVESLLTHKDRVVLAPIPAGIPDALMSIAEKVRHDPAAYWPVPEAAKVAGYSPYHFSRVFKSTVGFGFQEFVDRCRTENALEHLRTSRRPVDDIAEECGFGQPQALRKSLRDYLSIVPSDLRNLEEPEPLRNR